MPVIASLALALSPMLAALGRLIVGAGIALLTYQLIDQTVRPYFEDVFIALVGSAQDMQSIGDSMGGLYNYFEFTKIIQLVVAAYVAAFSIRVAKVAFSAFAVSKS